MKISKFIRLIGLIRTIGLVGFIWLIYMILATFLLNVINFNGTEPTAIQQQEQFSEKEREICIQTFNAFLEPVDSLELDRKEQLTELVLRNMDGVEEETIEKDYYRKNYLHVNEVFKMGLELVEKNQCKELLDLLETELNNIYGHPNADTYNCWALHSVLSMLYSKFVEDNEELFTKLVPLGEYSKITIEAVQADWETPHPLYKYVLNELLQMYQFLGNKEKIAENEQKLKDLE